MLESGNAALDILRHVPLKGGVKDEGVHCFDAVCGMTKGLKTRDTHYTSDGCQTLVTFHDGLEYEVTVRPAMK